MHVVCVTIVGARGSSTHAQTGRHRSRPGRRARQELTIQVPVTRLHIVLVDDAGVARLTLEPRFEQERGVGRPHELANKINSAETQCFPPVTDSVRTKFLRSSAPGVWERCGRPEIRASTASSRSSASRFSTLPGSSGKSEEHTSELQSPCNLVCRLLLGRKKQTGSEKLKLASGVT